MVPKNHKTTLPPDVTHVTPRGVYIGCLPCYHQSSAHPPTRKRDAHGRKPVHHPDA